MSAVNLRAPAAGRTVIYKYRLPAEKVFTLKLPKGAELMKVMLQVVPKEGPQPHIWAAVDPTAELEAREFRLIPTGVPFDEPVIVEGNGLGKSFFENASPIFDLAKMTAQSEGVALLYLDSFQVVHEGPPLVFHLFEVLRAHN